MTIKVAELIRALQGCPQDSPVKVLGEHEGEDLDINPSVVVLNKKHDYVALVLDRLDVDEDEEQVLYDSEEPSSDEPEAA